MDQNFLDPQKMSDGRPYGPVRYKQILKQCYYMTKNTSTSFHEALQMAPTEMNIMLGFLEEENEKTQELIDNAKKEAEQRRKRH